MTTIGPDLHKIEIVDLVVLSRYHRTFPYIEGSGGRLWKIYGIHEIKGNPATLKEKTAVFLPYGRCRLRRKMIRQSAARRGV
jgi:hypothetical protein